MYLVQKYKTRDNSYWWDKNRYQFEFLDYQEKGDDWLTQMGFYEEN